jgi:hypothetical protein
MYEEERRVYISVSLPKARNKMVVIRVLYKAHTYLQISLVGIKKSSLVIYIFLNWKERKHKIKFATSKYETNNQMFPRCLGEKSVLKASKVVH